jgi:hypothetical protein
MEATEDSKVTQILLIVKWEFQMCPAIVQIPTTYTDSAINADAAIDEFAAMD